MPGLTDLQARVKHVLEENGAPMTADAIAKVLRTSAHGIKLSLASPNNYVIVMLSNTTPGGQPLYRVADQEYWAARQRERAS